MTDKQPEALLYADILEYKIPSIECLEKAAVELRRLHEVNAELVEALRLIHPFECDKLHHEKKHRHSYAEPCPVKEWIDGVLRKAQGENNASD